MADLRLQLSAASRTRHYKHVHYHNKSKTWVAQQHGHPSLGSHPCQHAVARLASKAFKLPLEQLRLRSKQRASLESKARLQQRFADMWQIYRGTDPDHPSIPGDLADISQRASLRSPQLLTQAPGLIVAFLLAKYKLHRDATEMAWAKVSKRHPSSNDPVQDMFDVWQVALRELHAKAVPKAWTTNIGRNTTHHFGLIVLAHRSLRLIRRVRRWTPGTLLFGQEQKPFRLTKLCKSLRARLQSHLDFGHALMKIRAPSSIDDWEQAVKTLQEALVAHRVKGQTLIAGFVRTRSYRTMWVIRTWLIFRMRLAGVLRLTNMACSLSRFSNICPDQKKWIAKVAGRGNGLKCTQAFLDSAKCPSFSKRALHAQAAFKTDTLPANLCRYDGPPECFSMFACLWGDAGLLQHLQQHPDSWLADQQEAMIKAHTALQRSCQEASQTCLGEHMCLKA